MESQSVDESHPDMARKRAVLQRCYERRKFAADCFLEHQKANHKSLFDFELREAQALHDEGCRRLRENFTSVLAKKRQRLLSARDRIAQELEERPTDARLPSTRLTEDEIRTDLTLMLEDLQSKAQTFKHNDRPTDVKVGVKDGQIKLDVEKHAFGTGDLVNVTSKPLNRDFLATITAINATHLSLTRKSSDPHDPPATLQLALAQIGCGRVTLSHV